jgi:DNA-damage-inducible protein D
MNQEEIQKLIEKVEGIAYNFVGVECWSARQLQEVLGYTRWDSFKKIITKAKRACRNAGESEVNHFPEITRNTFTRRKAEKSINDVLLTRYAFYLVAQNGDSKIKEIALMQSYFTVKTHMTELAEKGLLNQQQLKIVGKDLSEYRLASKSGGKDMYFLPEVNISESAK